MFPKYKGVNTRLFHFYYKLSVWCRSTAIGKGPDEKRKVFPKLDPFVCEYRNSISYIKDV